MKKILISYASNAGSTAEIAQRIASQMRSKDIRVDCKVFHQAGDLDLYDGIVLGGPMMMGWHPAMMRFSIANQAVLADKAVAIFITALTLTNTGETNFRGSSLFLDDTLAVFPRNPLRLGFKERRTSIASYLEPVFSVAPSLKPASIAFFGGKLDYGKLKFKQKLIAFLLIGAKAGDRRNWDAINNWTENLKNTL